MRYRDCLFWPPALAQAGRSRRHPYRIIKTIPIGAPDRWDYVVLDPSGTQALCLARPRPTVVDLKAGKVAGTMNVGGTTHGAVAITASGQGLYR